VAATNSSNGYRGGGEDIFYEGDTTPLAYGHPLTTRMPRLPLAKTSMNFVELMPQTELVLTNEDSECPLLITLLNQHYPSLRLVRQF
jgi:hypothetical protein